MGPEQHQTWCPAKTSANTLWGEVSPILVLRITNVSKKMSSKPKIIKHRWQEAPGMSVIKSNEQHCPCLRNYLQPGSLLPHPIPSSLHVSPWLSTRFYNLILPRFPSVYRIKSKLLSMAQEAFTMEFQCPFPDSSLPTSHSSPNQTSYILC